MTDQPIATDPGTPEPVPPFVPNSVHVAPVVHDSIGAIALAFGFVLLLLAYLRLLDRYHSLLEKQPSTGS